MKSFYAILIVFALLIVSCQEKKELSISEKIANAHGFENWKNVTEVQFTFAVDRDTIKGNGRHWTWFPKKDSIVMKAGEQQVSYVRSKRNSVSKNADRAFINDKYWAFIPFQLIWDDAEVIEDSLKRKAPISATELNKLTIVYPKVGGYTPGDAYDIYYDDDFMIREWSFRQGNSDEPSLSNTFENYKDYNGIKIATDHKKDDGKWNLKLTDIKVKTKIKVF